MKHSKRILMIINEFPPVGESGVQRPLKFCKYLSKAGWIPFVVTPKVYPKNVFDHSLEKDIPANAKIFKTHSWGIPAKGIDKIADIREQIDSPKSPLKKLLWHVMKIVNDILLPFDKQVGWVPFALAKSIVLIQRYKIHHVYITAFPFSAFLIGIALKQIYKNRIFWVADYRDAWQFAPVLQKNVIPLRFKIITRWDDLCIKYCDKAIFTTPYCYERYSHKHPRHAHKLSVITNGFDEDDFQNLNPISYDKFTLLYMGKIFSFKGSPLPLLRAIRKSISSEFSYIHIGTLPPNIKAEINKEEMDFYDFKGYKSHLEALNYAAAADMNILIVNDDPESSGVYPGKLFELIRLGKPILALGPPKSLIRDIISEHSLGEYAPLKDEEAISQCLLRLCNREKSMSIDAEIISRFSRKYLCAKLITLLEEYPA